MNRRGYYRKLTSRIGKQEVFLHVRKVEGAEAICDELILAEHEEDDRVFHNLTVPLRLLLSDYKRIDENNPLMDLLAPICM